MASGSAFDPYCEQWLIYRRPRCSSRPVMLKYAGEYCEYGEPYGEAADACQSLVAVIRSRNAGVN